MRAKQSELITFLNEFKEKKCWATTGGVGSGSMFSIHLGEQIKRPEKVNNQFLSEALTNNEGEYIIFVYMAYWGLFVGGDLLVCAADSQDKIGKHVQKLINHRFIEFEILENNLQYELKFDNDVILKIAYREGYLKPEDDLFVLYKPSFSIAVSRDKIEFN